MANNLKILTNELKDTKNKFYFAHRGAPWAIEENTIPSFSKAIDFGCGGIEMDVQKTKDNYIIILHDDHIVFNNSYHKISELTYSTIKHIMRANQKPEPPLFSSIIPIIKKSPNIILNIEIKSKALNNYIIIHHIKTQLKENKVLSKCIISSFNYLLLLQMNFFFKEATSAFIMGRKRLEKRKLWINKLLIKMLGPQFIHANWKFLKNDFLDWTRNKNIGVSVYTINNKQILQKMIDKGISVFFTDNHKFYLNSISND